MAPLTALVDNFKCCRCWAPVWVIFTCNQKPFNKYLYFIRLASWIKENQNLITYKKKINTTAHVYIIPYNICVCCFIYIHLYNLNRRAYYCKGIHTRTLKHRRSVKVDITYTWKKKRCSYREEEEERETAEHLERRPVSMYLKW